MAAGPQPPHPEPVTFTPIGLFHCRERHPYDAARQGTLAANQGRLELYPGQGYDLALRDLAGFSHLWLIYIFHHNRNWQPLVQPPRGPHRVGVFASRAPYRPNPIGLSCVELLAIEGLTLHVRGHDLLDGTPVLDIKPYLPYADSHPAARTGWLAAVTAAAEPPWQIAVTPPAAARLAWLAAHGADCLEPFLRQQLAHAPLDRRRKRLRTLPDGTHEIAYRTWRIRFRTAAGDDRRLEILTVASGYTPSQLAAPEDRYADKELHRAFRQQWPSSPPEPGSEEGHPHATPPP
ncbi:MAG: tRNA (N6-threonylcarbamoyladenosine(37)-N6)-methyltransferase TrmO [Lentisphaeria bacterium]|jgi:tRNA-Thr(GGU) m(6)t(6)A37 methyltransferase TsaA